MDAQSVDRRPSPARSGGSNGERRPRLAWYHLYFALAGFDLVTIATSLYLSHHLNTVFERSVQANAEGLQRLASYEQLGRLASAVNAPGNDVFDSRDVEAERAKMAAQLETFSAASGEAGRSMASIPGPIGRQLEGTLAEVELRMQAMLDESRSIFSYFENGQPQLAGERMATMDRRYSELLGALGSLQKIARDDLQSRVLEQAAFAQGLRKLEFVVGGAILLMIAGITYYGHRLSKSMRAATLAQARHTAELEELSERLKVSTQAAESASDAKTRFLAGMSHEIRTPLNGIIGFADLLRRRADEGDEQQRAEWIGIIHGSSTHLLNLLNDVLDLSKLDVDKMDIAASPCNPREVISESVLILKSRAEEKGLRLEVSFDPGVPEAIRTDGTRLRQIMMNLVSNAVKFTEEGGVKVAVSLVAPPSPGTPALLRVTVSDTGIGLTAEQGRQLFKPFQQADRTIANRFGGTGLGLVISQGLAQRLGGGITFLSTPGVGSEFTLTIAAPPLLAGESLPRVMPTTDAWDSGKPGAKSPLAGRTVLVVDDVEANRKVCSIFLGRAGAHAVLACDGQEAVELCRKKDFDLVLMDIQMPTMNGNDATKAIRASGFRKPILALTAFSSGADREDCLAAGMNDFLSKPIESAVMIQSVTRWIREHGRAGASGDRCTLSATRGMDPDLEAAARAWLAEMPPVLDEIEAALSSGNFENASRGAHAIKGVGGSLGLPEFTERAAALESAAKSRSLDLARASLQQLRQMHRGATSGSARRAA